MSLPFAVFLAATVGVGLCFAGFLYTARRTDPVSTHRRVYGWLGAALTLFWVEVAVVVAYLTGMVTL